MATPATYDDVKLILKLYDMRREARLRTGREWFTRNFRPKTVEEIATICPPGTDENASYRMVVTYWEMVASFITAGVLNEELFFQSGAELLLVYTRLRHLLPQMRAHNKNPAQYRNLEVVAQNYIKWFERNDPEAYKAFAARVG